MIGNLEADEKERLKKVRENAIDIILIDELSSSFFKKMLLVIKDFSSFQGFYVYLKSASCKNYYVYKI